MVSRLRGHPFMVNDRVRPSLEVLEQDPTGPGFVTAAIIYGYDKEEVVARANLISEWMSAEGSRAALRKRLRRIAWYQWAVHRHSRARHKPNLFTLLALLLGTIVDTDHIGEFLASNWPETGRRAP